jgi:hypothetical protein
MTNEKIKQICRKYHIYNYTINEDKSIDVIGNVVFIPQAQFSKLPLNFNKVSGSFKCLCNGLTTLEGSPKWVGRSFIIMGSSLTSLKYAPQYVNGSFYCIKSEISSFEYSPEKVGGDFKFISNNLTSLMGCPNEIGGDFVCSQRKNIDSFEHAPANLKGHFKCILKDLTTESATNYLRLLYDKGYDSDKINIGEYDVNAIYRQITINTIINS